MLRKEGYEARLAVGVDVGKYELVAAIWLADKERAEGIGAFANTPEGIEQLIQKAQEWQKKLALPGVHVTVEPTGKYEICLIKTAYQRKWQVSVVTPTTVRDFAGTLRRRAKTDQQDAMVLAQYTADRNPSAWVPPTEAMDDLDMLLSRRADLATMLRAEHNRKSSFASRGRVTAAVQNTLDETIAHLEKSLEDIDQAIADQIHKDPPMADHAKNLDTIPGVGPKTVVPIMATMMHFAYLTGNAGNHRGLTAFVGLDATVHQSGVSVRKKGLISKKGDPIVRCALYQAALGAIRGNNAVHDYYDRLVASGKPKMVALVACAHKILIWAWHVFITNKPYDPSLHAKTA